MVLSQLEALDNSFPHDLNIVLYLVILFFLDHRSALRRRRLFDFFISVWLSSTRSVELGTRLFIYCLLLSQ